MLLERKGNILKTLFFLDTKAKKQMHLLFLYI